MPDTSKIIAANWVLSVSDPPIQNGAIAIEAGRIMAVGTRDDVLYSYPTLEVHAFPNATIIPGLVNAHTHLEFSDREKPLGYQGISLPEWIRLVIQSRRETDSSSKRLSIAKGLKELAATGTVAVGEISTAPTNTIEDYSESPLVHKTIFLEQLTRDLNLLTQRADEAASHLSQSGASFGLSPHAPYSTHPQLVEQLVDAAIEQNAPLAMHVAETREELELLESRSGNFVELLEGLGVWNPNSFGDADSIDNIIEQLGRHKRSLLVHGNYLTDIQLQRIAELKISIAFCPRTHAWFGHETYPLSRMLELGINVAVGTDSRGSNPDLNLLEDLKLVANSHPSVSSSTILAMGTIHGAKALGLSDQLGTIEPGKAARVAIIESSEPMIDPWWWLGSEDAAAD